MVVYALLPNVIYQSMGRVMAMVIIIATYRKGSALRKIQIRYFFNSDFTCDVKRIVLIADHKTLP